jgi:hypothetical protein
MGLQQGKVKSEPTDGRHANVVHPSNGHNKLLEIPSHGYHIR